MKSSRAWVVTLPVLGLLPFAIMHCGSGVAPPKADAGTPIGPAFSYSPVGCAYSFTPPDPRAFTAFAPDDAAAPTDTAGAAPLRVRIGLGGATNAGAAGYADPTTTAAFTWETK